MSSNADGTRHRVRAIEAQRYTLRVLPHDPLTQTGGADLGQFAAEEPPTTILGAAPGKTTKPKRKTRK